MMDGWLPAMLRKPSMRWPARRRLLDVALLVATLTPGCPDMCGNEAYNRHINNEGWRHVYTLPPERVWPEVRAVLAQRHADLPERVPALDEEVVVPERDYRGSHDKNYRVVLESRFLRGGYRLRIHAEELTSAPEHRIMPEKQLVFDVLERVDAARGETVRAEARQRGEAARRHCEAWMSPPPPRPR
jgi:hypothetical protein